MGILKVSARSRSAAVAGTIAGVVREHGRAEVQAIGAGAVNQATKAVAIAHLSGARRPRRDLYPSFVDIEVGDEGTAVKFIVEALRPSVRAGSGRALRIARSAATPRTPAPARRSPPTPRALGCSRLCAWALCARVPRGLIAAASWRCLLRPPGSAATGCRLWPPRLSRLLRLWLAARAGADVVERLGQLLGLALWLGLLEWLLTPELLGRHLCTRAVLEQQFDSFAQHRYIGHPGGPQRRFDDLAHLGKAPRHLFVIVVLIVEAAQQTATQARDLVGAQWQILLLGHA